MAGEFLTRDKDGWKIDLNKLIADPTRKFTISLAKREIGHVEKIAHEIKIKISSSRDDEKLYIVGDLKNNFSLSIHTSCQLILAAHIDSRYVLIGASNNIIIKECVKAKGLTICNNNNKVIIENNIKAHSFLLSSSHVTNYGLINVNFLSIESSRMDFINCGNILVGRFCRISLLHTGESKFKRFINEGDLFVESGGLVLQDFLNNGDAHFGNVTFDIDNGVLTSTASLALTSNSKLTVKNLFSYGQINLTDNAALIANRIANYGELYSHSSNIQTEIFTNHENAHFDLADSSLTVDAWYKEGRCETHHSKVNCQKIFDKSESVVDNSVIVAENINQLPVHQAATDTSRIKAKYFRAQGSEYITGSDITAEHFDHSGSLTLNESKLHTKHLILSGNSPEDYGITGSEVTATEHMLLMGKQEFKQTAFIAKTTLLQDVVLNIKGSGISSDKLDINKGSEIRGNQLAIKAKDMQNCEGSVYLDDGLEISTDTLINLCGTLASARNFNLTSQQYIMNMRGQIKAQNLQVQAGFEIVNLLGLIRGQNHLNLNTLVATNIFGLTASLNLNSNTLCLQNLLSLIIPDLPTSINGLFSWQHLISFAKMNLMASFPHLSTIVNLGFELLAVLRNVYAWAHSFYKKSSRISFENLQLTDFVSALLLVKSVAIAKRNSLLQLPTASFNWSDVSFKMITGEDLLTHCSSAFGPTINLNSVRNDNYGMVFSHNLSINDLWSNNSCSQEGTGLHVHTGYIIYNDGSKKGKQLIITGNVLENNGIIQGASQNYFEVGTFNNLPKSQLNISGGTIKTNSFHHQGDAKFEDLKVSAKEIKIEGGLQPQTTVMDTDTIIITKQATVENSQAPGSILFKAKGGVIESRLVLGKLGMEIDGLNSADVTRLLTDKNQFPVTEAIYVETKNPIVLTQPIEHDAAIGITATSIDNTSLLTSKQSVTLRATQDHIHNANTISGDYITLEAQGDITQHMGRILGQNINMVSLGGNVSNTGGQIKASRSLYVEAKKDIFNGCETRSWQGRYDREVDWTAGVFAGDTIDLRAENNVIVDASVVESETVTKVSAGKDIISQPRTHTRVVDVHKRKRWGNVIMDRIVGTHSLAAHISSHSGKQALMAHTNVHLQGSKISAVTTQITAGDSVTLDAKLYSETYSHTKMGFLRSIAITGTKEYAIPTEVKGSLEITSSNAVKISGTHLHGNVKIKTKNAELDDVILKETYRKKKQQVGVMPVLKGVNISYQQTTTNGSREYLFPTTFSGQTMTIEADKVKLGISATIPELNLDAKEVHIHGHAIRAEEKNRSTVSSVTVTPEGIQGASFNHAKSHTLIQSAVPSQLSVGRLNANIGKLVCDNATLRANTANGQIETVVHQERLNEYHFSGRSTGINTNGDVHTAYSKKDVGTVSASQGLVIQQNQNMQIKHSERQAAHPYKNTSRFYIDIPVGDIVRFIATEPTPVQHAPLQSATTDNKKIATITPAPKSTRTVPPKSSTQLVKPRFNIREQLEAAPSESQRKLAFQPPMGRLAKNIFVVDVRGRTQQHDAKTGRYVPNIFKRLEDTQKNHVSKNSAQLRFFKNQEQYKTDIVGVEVLSGLQSEGKIELTDSTVHAGVSAQAIAEVNHYESGNLLENIIEEDFVKTSGSVSSSTSVKLDAKCQISRKQIDIGIHAGAHASVIDTRLSTEVKKRCSQWIGLCVAVENTLEAHAGAIGGRVAAGLQTSTTSPGLKLFVSAGAMAGIGTSQTTIMTITKAPIPSIS